MTTGANQAGFAGQQRYADSTSLFNAISFLIQQAVGIMSTATIVRVQAVTNAGNLAPAGTVDVLPLVNLLDGIGRSSQHGTVYGMPYFRLQGGRNAIIIDPEVGDLGLVVFCDRDISAVKSVKAQANPGSGRRFDFSDGLYLGGFLNGTPEQYVRLSSAGADIADKNGNTIVMDSRGITFNGVTIDRSGNISGAGTVMATGEGTFGGHTVGHHTHISATPGSPTSLPTG